MIYGLGMQELLVILAIAMLLFGGKRLPEVGRNLGKAIRGFKQAEDETMKELKKAAEGGEPEKEKNEKEAEGTKGDEATERESPETAETTEEVSEEEPKEEEKQPEA